jgi:hypothetical protein
VQGIADFVKASEKTGGEPVLGRIISSGFYRLAGGTIPFIRRYTTICP